MHQNRPAFPMSELTDSELRRYRRDLERSLRGLPAAAPVRELVQERLLAVLAEEASRTTIRSGA